MRSVARVWCLLLRSCSLELTASFDRPRGWLSTPLRLDLWHRAARGMGCCGSKLPIEASHPLDGSGICHKQLFPAYTSPTGLQVRASTASWVATLPFLEFCQFRQDDTNLFMACFEPQDGNKAAAAYASSQAYQVFQAEMTAAYGDTNHALQSTFHLLDEGFRCDTNVAGQDQASSSATGTIVYIDFKTEKVWLAQIGPPGRLVLGQLFHGLAVQRTRAVTLDSTFREPKANSSCIGAGALKPSLTSGLCTAHVTEQRLNAGDEHLVVATQGFWDVVSADDAALLLHFHLKANASQITPAVTLTCDTTRTPLQAATPEPCGPATANAAESLVLYGMGKVARAVSRSLKPKVLFNEADLKGLAFTQSGTAGSVPKSKPLAALTRRDVHGDMSAVVVSLRWPATSLNQALEMPMYTPPPKGKYRGPEQQAAAERAQQRWRQIKMLHIEFYRARRVMLLNKWWKACNDILAKGRVKARQLEEQLWIQRKMAVKVSPALHITDQYGRVVHPEDINLQLPEV